MPPEPDYVPPGYHILNLLGSGQTSHVYLAEHAQRGRVALKLPRKELKGRPILRRMFENEVQITLNLKHPNIVIALDGYPTGERAFLALEYCSGRTLDELLLERGQLPLEPACTLVLDVAGGLEHSHACSVLHRDVKPANVFLTAEGRAKLGDFGTGLYLSEPSSDRVGTAFYMAPEIFGGGSATVQSDIYSLGILAYEVIAGVRPFAGESYEALMMAHLSGLPKPLRHYRAQLSNDATKVVACAMSRDPEKRYRTIRDFITAFSKATGRAETPRSTAPTIGRASRVSQKPDDKKAERRGLARWFGRKKS